MTQHDIIVIGASAGGIEALISLVKLLPEDFPASVFITVHVPAEGTSNLPTILRRASQLEAVHPRYHEAIRQGYMYVAPPNWHMTLEDTGVVLVAGPRENGVRPAIDPLFHSAAATFGQRVIGIILSGSRDDGTAGMAAIKAHGGITIAQDPDEAGFSSMPKSAIENVNIDYVYRIADIATLLIQLTKAIGENQKDKTLAQTNGSETSINLSAKETTWNYQFSCPDCGGVLLPQQEGSYLHFQCEVGHKFSPQTLLADQEKLIENALWVAARALGEKARLTTKLADQMRERGSTSETVVFDQQSQSAYADAETIKKVLSQMHVKDDNL